MGIYVFSREVLLQMRMGRRGPTVGREIIPSSLNHYRVKGTCSTGMGDVGTIESFYDANILLTERTRRSSSTTRSTGVPARAISAALTYARLHGARSIVADGCFLIHARSNTRCRHPHTVRARHDHHPAPILLGADTYDVEPDSGTLGIGATGLEPGDYGQERVAWRRRAAGERGGRSDADGEGYYIRNGIIICAEVRPHRAGTGHLNRRCVGT